MSAPFKGRREDRRLLTGKGRFTADWDLPGQTHAAFLRSDRAHASDRLDRHRRPRRRCPAWCAC